MTLYTRRNGRRYGQIPLDEGGGEHTDGALLLEDDTDLLLEDGTAILLE